MHSPWQRGRGIVKGGTHVDVVSVQTLDGPCFSKKLRGCLAAERPRSPPWTPTTTPPVSTRRVREHTDESNCSVLTPMHRTGYSHLCTKLGTHTNPPGVFVPGLPLRGTAAGPAQEAQTHVNGSLPPSLLLLQCSQSTRAVRRGRDLGEMGCGGDNPGPRPVGSHLKRKVARVWDLPRQHLPHDDRKREHVGRLAGAAVTQHLTTGLQRG